MKLLEMNMQMMPGSIKKMFAVRWRSMKEGEMLHRGVEF